MRRPHLSSKCRDEAVLLKQADLWPIASWIHERTVYGNSDTILDWPTPMNVHCCLKMPKEHEKICPTCHAMTKAKNTNQRQIFQANGPGVLDKLGPCWTSHPTQRFSLDHMHSTDLGHTIQVIQDCICLFFRFSEHSVFNNSPKSWPKLHINGPNHRAYNGLFVFCITPKLQRWLSILMDN